MESGWIASTREGPEVPHRVEVHRTGTMELEEEDLEDDTSVEKQECVAAVWNGAPWKETMSRLDRWILEITGNG